MIKVSDFIANFIAEHEDVANTVFMVSGGGNMHLIDSLGRNDKLEYVCNHHEQACALAAEGYARTSNKIGVAYVTTGPGGTNAITGVYSAWVDSIPTLTISGQVKFETTIASQPELKLRQLGDQEVNIIDLVKPVTKYAIMITDKNSVKYHLQKAVYEAKSSRPGPVWIDVPLDIQGAFVEESELIGFKEPELPLYEQKIGEVVKTLSLAKRPVVIAGNGIRLSGGDKEFLELLDRLQVPVVSTFARFDILNSDSEYYMGRYGTIGNRMANFTIQNADLVIAIGARMNIRAVSYNWGFFAREAKKIVVDIDPNELAKHTLKVDIPIVSDAKQFCSELAKELGEMSGLWAWWLDRCKQYKNDFPTIDGWRKEVKGFVDSYNFFDILSDMAKDDDIFVFGNATPSVAGYQSLRLKGKQRVLANSGCAAMGYDLPAAIGACYANGKNEVICFTGDGSVQMNIQELQTIIHYKLPIKIFLFNNQGYISIRNTQNGFFKGNLVGSSEDSGVSCPDMQKIAVAYGFDFVRIENQDNLSEELNNVLSRRGGLICELMIDPCEKMEPKLSSQIKPDGKMVSKPLEDMYPFLDREIFHKNMITKPME